MWLVVGLGNPGPKYAETRHNIGFIVADNWALLHKVNSDKDEHKSKTCRLNVKGESVILCKPLTYMNLSGEAVQPLMSFYKIDPDNLIVIHDDVDLPFGTMKFQRNRSAAGNNGLKSINQKIGTQDYMRVRFGVGRPANPRLDVADYVLQKFNENEMAELPHLIDHAMNGIESLITEGLEKTANNFTLKKETETTP